MTAKVVVNAYGYNNICLYCILSTPKTKSLLSNRRKPDPNLMNHVVLSPFRLKVGPAVPGT